MDERSHMRLGLFRKVGMAVTRPIDSQWITMIGPGCYALPPAGIGLSMKERTERLMQ